MDPHATDERIRLEALELEVLGEDGTARNFVQFHYEAPQPLRGMFELVKLTERRCLLYTSDAADE